jgi:hypothetical protein
MTPVVPTDSSTPVATLLAAYPHVARCAACRSYTRDACADLPATTVLAATLAHHDVAHATDPLLAASRHFAMDGETTPA